MAKYQLIRVADRKVFTAQRRDRDHALFYFSIVTGEALSFAGSGKAPYLMGLSPIPVGPVETNIPIYRED